MKGDKPCVETLQAARISQDGVLGAFVFENMEVFVYKFVDADLNLINEKVAKKPKKMIKVKFGHFRKAIDLFIFRQKVGMSEANIKYNMYLLFENGIMLI